MGIENISEWQRRFFEAPKVYVVFDSDGEVTNLYESREAAEFELAKHRRFRVLPMRIHSLELARERWA